MYVFCVALAYAHRATTLGRPYSTYGSPGRPRRTAPTFGCSPMRIGRPHRATKLGRPYMVAPTAHTARYAAICDTPR